MVLGALLSIKPVLEELKAGYDALADWAKDRPRFFHDIGDAQTLQKMAEIADWVTHQEYTQAALAEFLSVADHGHTVLTHEHPSPGAKKRVLIPNVCVAFGVRYTDTFQMMRILGAHF